jgi:hypothetical protein
LAFLGYYMNCMVLYGIESYGIEQEASEEMMAELFVKADLARSRVGRKTLHMDDVKFAKYITNDPRILAQTSESHIEPV